MKKYIFQRVFSNYKGITFGYRTKNIASFTACSQLLASLSGYPYTRKAWKKDVLDLLLDPVFFQMTAACLPYWRTVIDNLMTHDNTTFRDLLGK